MASVPVTRMGEEIGWTTLYYHSRYTDDRRDIWRSQWRSRMKIDNDKHSRHLDDTHQRAMDRNRRAIEHKEEMWRREDEEKRLSSISAERAERKKKSLDVYAKEIDVIRSEELDAYRALQEERRVKYFHIQDKLRDDRRKQREEELKVIANEAPQVDYVAPTGRPFYRTKQRDVNVAEMEGTLHRRRDELKDRIDRDTREEQNKELTRTTYMKYDDLAQRRKERIKRREEEEQKNQKVQEDEHEKEEAGRAERERAVLAKYEEKEKAILESVGKRDAPEKRDETSKQEKRESESVRVAEAPLPAPVPKPAERLPESLPTAPKADSPSASAPPSVAQPLPSVPAPAAAPAPQAAALPSVPAPTAAPAPQASAPAPQAAAPPSVSVPAPSPAVPAPSSKTDVASGNSDLVPPAFPPTSSVAASPVSDGKQ